MPFVLLAVAVFGLAGLVILLAMYRRQEQRTRRQLRQATDALTRSRALAESDLALLRTDLTLQAAQLRDLAELDPEPAIPLQDHLLELTSNLDELSDELAGADAPHQVQRATAAMSHTRQALATLTTRLVGDDIPPVRPPCFFNPNHGPSATIVIWTGANDHPVRVPCCAADAERLRSGAAPYSRTVANEGVRVPWWEAGPTVRPWALGWFQGWLGTTSTDVKADIKESFPNLFAEAV